MIYIWGLLLLGAVLGYLLSTTLILILTALAIVGCVLIWRDVSGVANGDAGIAAGVLTLFAACLVTGAWALKLILFIWPHLLPHIEVHL